MTSTKFTAAATAAAPAVGYLLYKSYKDGTLEKIKNQIFGKSSDNAISGNQPLSQQPDLGFEPASHIGGEEAENIVFDPNVFQFYNDTCAIKSQQLVLQQFGINVSQEELIDIAKVNGWYAEGYGTPQNMVGNLLEHFGVGVKSTEGNNIFNISNELAQGHQVIAAVDGMELVDPDGNRWKDLVYGQKADHALVVSGIDTTDPDNVKVIITDPGNGNKLMEYPAEQFMDAWKDSNCFMVSTDNVPTVAPLYPFQPIPSFAGIPTDDLAQLAGMDIDTEQQSYDQFIDDLLSHPTDFDSLINNYDSLFDTGNDDAIDSPEQC